MEVKKNIKKIVSVCVGTVMVGASIVGAMAANLSDYPSPFVKDGKFNGLIVVGDQAKAEDVIGATDIAMSLQYSMATKKSISTGGATSVVVSGDAIKIAESTNKLEFGEALNSIRTSVTASDLTALKGGSITNEKGTYSYTETIDLPTAQVEYGVDSEDDTDTVKDYLVFDDVSPAYTYKMTFSPALKSDITTSTGILNDLDNKDVSILGKKYTLLSPKYEGVDNIKLTLMGGATKDIMEEGATKTFTINGKDFEVTVDWIGTSSSTDKAKFTINGETTDSLASGETYKLADGTQIGVLDVLQNEAGESAGGDKVEFNIGADKIEISDSDTILNIYTSDCEVVIGSETMSNVACNIVAATTTSEVQISELDIQYTPSQILYVGKDKGTSVVADVAEEETGNFFTNAFDIEYKGLEIPKTEVIKLSPSGNDNYKIDFTNKAGVKYSTEIFTINSGVVSLGKDTKNLVIDEATSINDEDYFIVSKNKYSRILQYKDINTADKIVKIKDVGSGVINEVTYNPTTLNGNLVLDGNTYQVTLDVDSSAAKLTVDLNADGDQDSPMDDNGAQMWTQYGAAIALTNDIIAITSEDKENNAPDVIAQELFKNVDKIDLTSGVTGATLLASTEDSDKYVGYTTYGMNVEQNRQSSASDQDTLTVTYPDSQVFAGVYVTSGLTTSTTSGNTGEITTQEIVKIDVGASVLASEIAGKETTQNLILVGGPCANAASAVIMGNPSNCVEGFTAGQATIKLYENNGKVAMLVAGATALDTRGASKYVAQYDTNKALFSKATKEITLTVASLNSITGVIPAAVIANTTNTTTV